MENPTLLEMTLNKQAYKPGETAKLNIKAPFAGKLLLTVEREKILSYKNRQPDWKHSKFKYSCRGKL